MNKLNSLPRSQFYFIILIVGFVLVNIPVFAMVDTNSDPNQADYPIPANDDSFKSIELIVRYMSSIIEEGLAERKADKEEQARKEEESKKKEEAPAAPAE